MEIHLTDRRLSLFALPLLVTLIEDMKLEVEQPLYADEFHMLKARVQN